MDTGGYGRLVIGTRIHYGKEAALKTRSVTAVRGAAAGAVLMGAAALSACGPAAQNPATGTPASSSASAGSTPSAPASPPSAPASGGADAAGTCATANLSITVDVKQSGGAAGSIYYPIDFTNTGGSSCTLFGYPGVSFVTGKGGSEIGAPATRNHGASAAHLTLAPGGAAHAWLRVVEAGNYSPSACHPVTAHWLRVYPPGETVAGYAPFTTQTCSATLPAKLGSPLGVYPVRSGKGKQGQAP